MANEPNTPAAVTARLKALVERGPDSEKLERERSDSNEQRDSSSKQEQGSYLNNRKHGGSGTREVEAESNKRARELPIPSTTQQSIFTASDNILKTIADRFNEARESNRAGAWRQFQRDLMDASPYICPGLIPYKDLISVVADIEKEIKGSSASQTGKSNEELLSEFLNGGGSISIKDLDSHAMLIDGDQESPAASNAPEVA